MNFMDTPFWQHKSLAQMTEKEWESLCDGCGKCCLHKLIDEETNELYFTNVACNLLDSESCSCRDYANRFSYDEECTKLTQKNIDTFPWMPETCAYRRLSLGQALPAWHPLLTGSKKAMHEAGQSVRNQVVYEINVIDWEDHILENGKLSRLGMRNK